MDTKAGYLRTTWNLATQSLPQDAWPQFAELFDGFPSQGSVVEKLDALSQYLRRELAPKDVRANANLRHERIRADLNKYHDWVLNRILQQTLDEHIRQSKGGRLEEQRVILPEDLPKIIDDLYIFHKHHATIAERAGNSVAGTIQHYQTLVQFRDALDPFRPPNPLLPEARDNAYKSHLKEHGGDGEATLVATLEDGTVVIHLHTEKASRAFGSPRWCTAYPHRRTRFHNYKDDLLVVLEPNGRRYQIHFETGQFKDGNDKTASLPDTLQRLPGLKAILHPYLCKVLTGRYTGNALTLDLCGGVLEFEDEVRKTKFIQKAMREHHFYEIINSCKGHSGLEEILCQPDVLCRALQIFSSDDRSGWLLCSQILKACKDSPSLRKNITQPAGIAQAVKKILLSGIGPYSLESFLDSCRSHPDYAVATMHPKGFPSALRVISARNQADCIQEETDMIVSAYETMKTWIATQTAAISGSHLAAVSRPALSPRPRA